MIIENQWDDITISPYQRKILSGHVSLAAENDSIPIRLVPIPSIWAIGTNRNMKIRNISIRRAPFDRFCFECWFNTTIPPPLHPILKNYMKQIYYADAKARTPLVLSSRIQHRTTSLLLRVLSEMIPLMGKARKTYLEKQSNSSNTYLFIIYLHFFLERRCFSFRTPSVVHLVCHHFSRGTDNRDQIISLHVDLNGDDGTRFYLFPYSIYNILSVNHGCS